MNKFIFICLSPGGSGGAFPQFKGTHVIHFFYIHFTPASQFCLTARKLCPLITIIWHMCYYYVSPVGCI